MTRLSKRVKKCQEVVGESEKVFSLEEAIELLKKCPTTKFDSSIELSIKLGVDPKKADQLVRGTVILPHGSGRKVTLVVFAKGEAINEALAAGADFAGSDELIERVKNGWTDFSAVIATPEMMREVGKLGKVLGPRGLMPTPKSGGVTNDVTKAIKELKAGKIEYKVDKSGVINTIAGKVSFSSENLVSNLNTLIQAILKAKPATSKGQYVLSAYLSSTMGPGLKIQVGS